MRKLVALLILALTICSSTLCKAYPVTMYSADGRQITVSHEQTENYNKAGWYYTPVINIFASDGRKAVIPRSQLHTYTKLGWQEERKVTMYTLDGYSINIWASEAQSYRNVGWYDVPVTKMYARGGKTCVVALSEVSNYRKVGWHPLHSYIMESNYTEINTYLSKLQFLEYWPGTPNSGDAAQNYYTGVTYDAKKINYIGFYARSNECSYVSLLLVDVFPYLRQYADVYGNISVSQLNEVLGPNGIYGKHFYQESAKYTISDTCFQNFHFYSEFEWISGTYDWYAAGINATNYDGMINLNQATISLSSGN